jgi:hypothetical protein
MRTSMTHPLNVSYLVVGLVFLGVAGSWALQAADLVDVRDVSWLLPAVLVAAGVLGLVAMAARGVSRRRGEDTSPADDLRDDSLDDLYGPSDTTAHEDPQGGSTAAGTTEGDLR